MNFILKKENFFILCFLSLLLSLYFGENSSGGAYKDFLSTQKYLSVFLLILFTEISINECTGLHVLSLLVTEKKAAI